MRERADETERLRTWSVNLVGARRGVTVVGDLVLSRKLNEFSPAVMLRGRVWLGATGLCQT
jgi:hypothetical protein